MYLLPERIDAVWPMHPEHNVDNCYVVDRQEVFMIFGITR
jgi:hypothetical protein